MEPALNHTHDLAQEAESAPDTAAENRDWDPYQVWQNHINDVCPDAATPRAENSSDGWRPYKVWESLFK